MSLAVVASWPPQLRDPSQCTALSGWDARPQQSRRALAVGKLQADTVCLRLEPQGGYTTLSVVERAEIAEWRGARGRRLQASPLSSQLPAMPAALTSTWYSLY